MSFVFPSWETAFSPDFYDSAKAMLETALNKGNKPPVIHGHIEVVELSMGTQPPTLTLLEIGDLSLDRFRGILRLGYQGDAWLEVRCRVQANPLSHNPNLMPSSVLPLSTPLLASQPLLVPMTLRLSKLHLRAILILVVSASKGITLVFKNDPLQNVDVSSTFDSVEVIRGYLQQEIEGQLREMFREDLPGIIHRLSQRWFTGSGVGGRVEMPYRESTDVSSGLSNGISTPGKQSAPGSAYQSEDDLDPSDPYAERPIFPPYQPPPSISQLTPKRRALAQQAARVRRLSTAPSESPSAYTVFPDIEDYDPTYGLRPEGVPTHSGYEAFGRLWDSTSQAGKGLGSLMANPVGSGAREGEVSDFEEDEEAIDDEVEAVERDQVLRSEDRPGISRRSSLRSRAVSNVEHDLIEWESFPAVGGGHITRPRVFHAQSQIRAPSEAGGGPVPSPSATNGAGSVTARAASSVGGASSTVGSLRHQPMPPRTPGPRSAAHQRSMTGIGIAGPGPSSLRRMVTSRSDVFLSRSAMQPEHLSRIPTSSSYKSFAPAAANSRRLSTAPSHPSQHSSLNRQSGSSWSRSSNEKGGPTRSSTYSTMPTSGFPSSSSISIPSQPEAKASRSDLYQSGTSPVKAGHMRNPSMSGTSPPTASYPPRHSIIGPAGITLPLNNSVSQLAALSNSAHTLSPYARGHEHIAVRSFPHLGKGGSNGSDDSSAGLTAGVASREAVESKGNRKRIFRLGGKKEPTPLNPRGEVDTPPMMSPGQANGPEERYTSRQRSLLSSPDTSYGSLSFDQERDLRRGMRGMQVSPGLGGYRSLAQSGSLTGMASQLMAEVPPPHAAAEMRRRGNGLGISTGEEASRSKAFFRPNMARSPDSRSSYGFPTARRVL